MMKKKEYIQQLLEHLSKTEEQEATCEEVFDVLDIYTEAVARGEDPQQMLPLVKQHIEICRCCREEYETLLSILEAEKNQ
jgi:hypothetical protein